MYFKGLCKSVSRRRNLSMQRNRVSERSVCTHSYRLPVRLYSNTCAHGCSLYYHELYSSTVQWAFMFYNEVSQDSSACVSKVFAHSPLKIQIYTTAMAKRINVILISALLACFSHVALILKASVHSRKSCCWALRLESRQSLWTSCERANRPDSCYFGFLQVWIVQKCPWPNVEVNSISKPAFILLIWTNLLGAPCHICIFTNFVSHASLLIKQKNALSPSVHTAFPGWGPNRGTADMV